LRPAFWLSCALRGTFWVGRSSWGYTANCVFTPGRRAAPAGHRDAIEVGGADRMTPKQLVQTWVQAFNRADVAALASLYTEDAVNHQVAESPVQGRENIREMFAAEFAKVTMHCVVENLFEDGDWAILEWRDPLGLRGCGFFHVIGGKIALQRGYWDKLSFLRQQGLPLPQR
jgi:limonene-1,2-epoxide hydrolase